MNLAFLAAEVSSGFIQVYSQTPQTWLTLGLSAPSAVRAQGSCQDSQRLQLLLQHWLESTLQAECSFPKGQPGPSLSMCDILQRVLLAFGHSAAHLECCRSIPGKGTFSGEQRL